MTIQRITTDHPLYVNERQLRNEVLLRPLGLPDGVWEIHDTNAWHFIACDGTDVVGCALLKPAGDHAAMGQVIQMAVKERSQRKGIGKQLMAALLDFCIEVGITEVICHAKESLEKFYSRLGFQTYGEPFLEVGIPHLHMKIIRQPKQL